MYSSSAKNFPELRQYLDNLPVIETHEHYVNYQEAGDTLGFILGNYYLSDFWSAGGEKATGMDMGSISADLSDRERHELFVKYYKKSDKTAYARGMQEGLRMCWGVNDISDYDEYKQLEEKLKNRDASVYNGFMEKLNIKAKVVDIFDLSDYVDGKTGYSEYCRFAFPLPSLHNLHTKGDMLRLAKHIGRAMTCLDDYIEAFDLMFQKSIDFGVVCIKDQSAYRRPISYGNPSKAEAEKAFNDIIFNPRDVFGDDRVRVLDDWLFQYAMRKAAKYGVPVQIHTGHMAGIRNEIEKTNASHLIPTLELHPDVNFDIFHGNWPYMDEFLFIGKNYPNAWLNLCWAQSIDPIYCVELMKRAVMTVPHNKLFAFGGDTGMIEWVAGYLTLARDNVAIALSELVDSGWLNMGEAKQIAADWFFNNPNEFFKLGFDHL